MAERPSPLLRIGSTLLAVAMLGALAAPWTIARTLPDLSERAGRHLFAGILGLTALPLIGVVLALVPVRRGETWAVMASAIPLAIVAVPMLCIDATYVRRDRLFATLAPQAIGLALGITAWALCWYGGRRPK
jgi:hypothetical protein